jgi:hypothetical protein
VVIRPKTDDKNGDGAKKNDKFVGDDAEPNINNRKQNQCEEKSYPKNGENPKIGTQDPVKILHAQGDTNKEKPGKHLNERICETDMRLAVPAPAALDHETHKRDKFEPSKRSFTMRTIRPAADDLRIKQEMITVVAKREDITETPENRTTNKKKDYHLHCFIIPKRANINWRVQLSS